MAGDRFHAHPNPDCPACHPKADKHAALLAAAKAHIKLIETWGGSQEAFDSVAALRLAVEECEK